MLKFPEIEHLVSLTGNFASIADQCVQKGASIISTRDEAYIRAATAGDGNIGYNEGTYTSAGIEYVRGKKPLLRIHSRLLQIPRRAIEPRHGGVYLCTPTQAEYKESLRQAKLDREKPLALRKVMELPSRESFRIYPDCNFDVLEMLMPGKMKNGEKLADFFYNLHAPVTCKLKNKELIDEYEGTFLSQVFLDKRTRAAIKFNNYLHIAQSRGNSHMPTEFHGEGDSFTTNLIDFKGEYLVRAMLNS